MTLFTPKDSSGNTAIDWMTRFFVSTYWKPAPAIDGFFMDNVVLAAYIDGDWNRDGVVDSQTNPTVQSWLRQSAARYFAGEDSDARQISARGNIGDWGNLELGA